MKEGLAAISETVKVRNGAFDGGIDSNINRYLKVGWVILEIWIENHGGEEQRIEEPWALLGWPNPARDPVYPSIPPNPWDDVQKL